LTRAAVAARCGLLAVLAAAPAAAQERPAISTVEIRPTNVFTDAEAAQKFFLYRFANALHITTKASFIETQLLFKPGDPLEPEILAETERNLRAFGLFRRVAIRAEGSRIVVETADAWTLLLRGSLSNKGGVTTYSAGVEEYNLLGLGMQLGIGFEQEVDRTSRSIFFVDPNALAPHAVFTLNASDLSDGQRFAASYGRPFYALEVPWSLGGAMNRSDFDTRIYAGGEESATWKERQRLATITSGFLTSGDLLQANRLLASIEWNEVLLRPTGEGPPPPPAPASNRKFLFVSAGFEHAGSEWITRRQVDQIERDEDFNLATDLQIKAGVSPGFDTRGVTGQVSASFQTGTSFPRGFALFTSTGSTRLESGFQNAMVGADARGYVLAGPWTFVGRIGTLLGWNLDPENQIVLDGTTGVRGYRLYAVEGNRRLVGNGEARVLVVPEIWSLLSFGLAAFGDVGYSWGQPDGFWHLADAGVGLRIGITRASKNTLVRIDVARVLHPDPLGRTGWLVSFASGQAF
jgi:outer membrane protein assembly factor BamA